MVEVEYAYSKSHEIAIVYYQSAMYEVPYNALIRTGRRYKIDSSYLTEESLFAIL